MVTTKKKRESEDLSIDRPSAEIDGSIKPSIGDGAVGTEATSGTGTPSAEIAFLNASHLSFFYFFNFLHFYAEINCFYTDFVL
jgi:hypothetical protein